MSYTLTPGEKEILRKSLDPADGVGVNWFLSYFFEFEFRPWQFHFHHASQEDITVMAGTGSGKTSCAALSYFAWACVLPYYSFMNLAPTGWQSKLMFDKIMAEADRRPASKLIKSVVRRPYPVITIAHDLIGESTMEFRSAADDAYNIQGWEGDALNLDEAGQIMSGDVLIGMMGSRLRGEIRGRARQNRMSAISTSYLESPPWLWERMDMGVYDPVHYLSISTSSEENLSARDIEIYKRRIPESQWASLLGGQKPDGGGEHFSQGTYKACEDIELNRFMQYHTHEVETPSHGWQYSEVAGAGCIHFEMPVERGRSYILVGDPGQGNPPHRNAGVVMVFEITGFPAEPCVLRYFAWVYGNGSYDPFLAKYKFCHNKYKPVASLIDSTASQALWNEMVLVREGIYAEGMNFSGDKMGMLVAAINQMQRGLFKFPFIQGIKSQLINYIVTDDKKVPQDIVCCFMMVAYYLRTYIMDDYQESVTPNEPTSFYQPLYPRSQFTRSGHRPERQKVYRVMGVAR